MLSKNVQADFHLQYNVAANRGGHPLVERRPLGFLLMWIALIVLTSLTNCSESKESPPQVTPCTSVPVVKGTPTKVVGGTGITQLNQGGEFLVFLARNPSGSMVVQRVRKTGAELVTLFGCTSQKCSILYVSPTEVFVNYGDFYVVRIPLNQGANTQYELPFDFDGVDVYGDYIWGFRDNNDGYVAPGLLSYSMSTGKLETIVPSKKLNEQDTFLSLSASGASWRQTIETTDKNGFIVDKTALYHLPYDKVADGPIKIAGAFEAVDTLISENDVFWKVRKAEAYGEPMYRWSKITQSQSEIQVPTTQCEDLAAYGVQSLSFLHANEAYVFVAFDDTSVFAISLEKPEWISLNVEPENIVHMQYLGVASDSANLYWTDGSLIYSVAFSQFK